jgi:microcystin-dependent protein
VSDQFVAEIRIVPINFAPKGWAFCNGQLMPISQNTALFSLLGTTYGGNGQSTFGLPDLGGRLPMFWSQGPGLTNRVIGESSGSQTVTLLASQMPAHTHALTAGGVAAAATADPTNAALGPSPARPYANAAPDTAMSPLAVGNAGSSLPHNNLPPYLVLNFIIALQGIFPPRT